MQKSTARPIHILTTAKKRLKRFIAWNPLSSFAGILQLEVFKRLGRKYVLKRVEGSFMLLPIEQGELYHSASNALIAFGKREILATEIYIKSLKRGMHVVDVGSHIGYYALIASRYVGDEGRVLAVEPNPLSFVFLKYNVLLNARRNIKIYNVALGEEEREITFCHNSRASNLSKVTEDIIEKNKCDMEIRVRQTTLDRLIGNERVDLIRMDVEGFEYRILKGARGLLSRQDNLMLFMELHPASISAYGGDMEEFFRELEGYGFKVKYFIIEPPIPIRGFSPKIVKRELRLLHLLPFLIKYPWLSPQVFLEK